LQSGRYTHSAMDTGLFNRSSLSVSDPRYRDHLSKSETLVWVSQIHTLTNLA